MLWPSAGKGGQNGAVHAHTHNFFVSANGNGENFQNFDRLGRPVGADASFNFTLPPRQQRHKKNPADVADGCFHPPCKPPRHELVLITVTTLGVAAFGSITDRDPCATPTPTPTPLPQCRVVVRAGRLAGSCACRPLTYIHTCSWPGAMPE